MQFTTFTLSALSIGSALAQTTHVVTVALTNGSKIFSPNNIVADVGDMVQFQFNAANHTVTQSTFDQPCQPISNITPNVTGVFSGFMFVSANDTNRPAFNVPITSKTPMWLYCSQATHCQAGMVAVINENVAANSTRSLATYASLAATAPTGLAIPNGVSASSSSSNSSSSGSSSGTSSSGSSSSGTSSGASSSSSSSTSSGSDTSASGSTTSTPAQSTNASGAGKASASTLLALSIAVALVVFA